MNQVKRFLVGATASGVLFAASTMSAFAHEGHTSCKSLGEFYSSSAQEIEKAGQFISTLAPLNDEVAAEHAIFCTPK
jgi:hypothetical protein